MIRHLMLLPSLACPARCTYCFGPHVGGPSMTRETIEQVVAWQNALGENQALEITFHGGEPLLPGAAWYRTMLPLLRDGLGEQTRFAVQSNLWFLTDELCELFSQYGVSLGTSLDGPEAINDAQRGACYYQRTMAGIERAHRHGLAVGCICTFTAQSALNAGEIFDFFLQQRQSFSIHAALPPLGTPGNGWSLAPSAHGDLLIALFDRYLAHAHQIRISTLDALCRSISAGHGGVCTFGDCLGNYLAVDPEGWIYPCQRLAGKPAYRLGHVRDAPSQQVLSTSPMWRLWRDRQDRIEQECGDCAHLAFCRGGCPYNALVANGGNLRTLRDPHCPAYRRILGHIADAALEEVFSPANLDAVVTHGPGKYGLLQRGRLLQIMRGGPHPQETAQQARKIAAAVALAVSATPEQAVEKLDRAGLVTDPVRARASVVALQKDLRTRSQHLVNCYLHVTYACNLTCDHCYASSGPRANGAMPVEIAVRLLTQAANTGFGKVVLTGGEPMAHPQRDELLDAVHILRGKIKSTRLVLRTNLAYSISPELLQRLAHSTDQVIVSVDGDPVTHDARRGAGIYARTIANLHTLVAARPSTQVVLAATLTAAQMQGPEGEAVRALAQELDVGVRFKPVLPLGRAQTQTLSPEFYSSLDEDGSDLLAERTHLAATCGLGMNLYIAPDGVCFPCYALTRARHELGNAITSGIAPILASDQYQGLKRVDVDSNARCTHCDLRYVCGGACRAWNASDDPDAPPADCASLYRRASDLLASALDALEVSRERWTAAGLPLPVDEPLKSHRTRTCEF